MPIYEYNCPKCGDFDQMQKITDEPLKKCPTCKARVTKMISNPAFHLKGAGWYVTDYGRKGGGSESKTDEASGGTSDAPSDKTQKTEQKADTKDKKADKKNAAASAAA